MSGTLKDGLTDGVEHSCKPARLTLCCDIQLFTRVALWN